MISLPFLIVVQLSPPFCYLFSSVGRKDDLFHSHCNGEVYRSYFCFVAVVSLTSISIDSKQPDKKQSKCRCAVYVVVSFVAWIAFQKQSLTSVVFIVILVPSCFIVFLRVPLQSSASEPYSLNLLFSSL